MDQVKTMTLEQWLGAAARGLSADSAAQLLSEITDHYESALASGASAREALAALGDPTAANRQYHKVMLTSAEAKQLRSMVRETRAICARPALKRLFIGMPVLLLCFASSAFYADAMWLAKILFSLGLVLGLVLAVPFLPIYTPFRSRIYRTAKWTGLAAALALLAGPQFWWLSLTSLSYMFFVEFLSMSIRRKLPATQWPKALYL